MPNKGGFFKYVKHAFLVNWNLLAVAAGAALAVISGQPDVVIPFVAAGELAYLAGLASHPKFQSAIDAQEHKSLKLQQSAKTSEKAQIILQSLSDEDRERFRHLRSLCNQLRTISQGVKGQTSSDDSIIDDLQMGSINRLLWIYLKLLYSKNALEKFFATIDEDEIKNSITKAQNRLDALGPEDESEPPGKSKKRKSLQDTLETSKARLANYKRAQDNHDFIELELDRLYTKISGLGEMSINRQDPNFITQEVDAVSASVEQTEKAMGELDFLTGLGAHDEDAPELLEEDGLSKILD